MARGPSRMGLGVGALFIAGSLVPALLPRPWYVQGVISGVALAIGYGIGAGLATAWRRRDATNRPPAGTCSTFLIYLVAVVSVSLVLWALVVHFRWQSDIRTLMGMESGVVIYLLLVMLTAPIVGFVLAGLGRVIGVASRRFVTLLQRWLSRRLAVGIHLATVLLIVLLFFDLVVFSQLVPALEGAHARSDRSFDPNMSQPSSSLLSGGPGSLIAWDRMGRQGRVFVAEAPSSAELEDFNGEPANEPIRVYVGLDVADTAASRADLAIAELERTRAFDREVIVLVAPTGSGWIDPYALGALEYMYNGSTAAVALQYSYLASWMVMIQNQDIATDASHALYSAVTKRLREEPVSSRPRLVIYGESLGAFGWERTFDRIENMTAAVDGALLVGPPRVNPMWRELVADRDPESPVWRPVVGDGQTVRFGPDRDSLLAPGPMWLQPRIVYLQHASDPITWLSIELITRRPEWLDAPRGPDVSRHTPFLPVITYVQTAIDLALGTNAPVGHGHKFGPAQSAAWSLILPPTGWDTEDTDVLLDHLGE